MPNPFAQSFDELPRVVPIFPLAGALLLPGGRLPLNIFEPRYLNMTQAAMRGDRVIGMIQPKEPERADKAQPVFDIGCAGRVIAYSETEDGRLLITLEGLCRFRVVEELAMEEGYRRVLADFARHRADMSGDPPGDIQRERLMRALKGYLTVSNINANWEAIQGLSDDRLVTTLSMICPFETSEKQALLEADGHTARAGVLTTLLEMALLSGGEGGQAKN
jgi:Lon protease-like protein